MSFLTFVLIVLVLPLLVCVFAAYVVLRIAAFVIVVAFSPAIVLALRR
jgi:hypothetical protein